MPTSMKYLIGAVDDLYLFINSSIYKPQLKQILTDLQINIELDLLNALISDHQNVTFSRAVRVASEQLKISVVVIHTYLVDIQQELEAHKSRLLHRWRRPNYSNIISELAKEYPTLRRRRKTLMSTLMFQRNKDSILA